MMEEVLRQQGKLSQLAIAAAWAIKEASDRYRRVQGWNIPPHSHKQGY
jgi:hypothetical protein